MIILMIFLASAFSEEGYQCWLTTQSLSILFPQRMTWESILLSDSDLEEIPRPYFLIGGKVNNYSLNC